MYILHVVISISCFLLQDIKENNPKPEESPAEENIGQLGETEHRFKTSDVPHTTLSKQIEKSCNKFLRQKKTKKKISIRSFSREGLRIESYDESDTLPKL